MKSYSAINELQPGQLIAFLEQFPLHTRCILASSGGKDSMVLAHLFSCIKKQINHSIQMVYVNHGLQNDSQSWGDFCREQAAKYQFNFQQIDISTKPKSGESKEAWAREVRYNAFSSIIDKNSLLFTAHHMDDQAETILLRLFRGTGVRGMSCMKISRTFETGLLVRPFLGISKDQIDKYVNLNHIKSIQDQSNEDDCFDRNYLRQKINPYIKKRWPAFLNAISRTIENQQEATELLDELAETDLLNISDENKRTINIEKLVLLGNARIKNVLMYWVRYHRYPNPTHQHLNQILHYMLVAKDEKLPVVNWSNIAIRKYRNKLYLIDCDKSHDLPKGETINLEKPTIFNGQTIDWHEVKGKGVATSLMDNHQFTLEFRQGGEKIRLAKQGITKTVKHLFQEKGVLPWIRESYPLIYIDNKLAVIPGICIAEEFSVKDDESGIEFNWTGYHDAIGQYD